MENSAPDRQQVRVTILSRPYTLLTSGDSREVEEVAASVNELMLSIAAKAPNADSTRIAVLACLHLADRMRTLERDLSQLKQRVDRKSEEFAGMLEQLIEDAGEISGPGAWCCRRWPGWRSLPPPPIRPKSPSGAASGKRA